MYCAYCGRLARRCQCHTPHSDLARFMARGGRPCAPLLRSSAYKRAVPPQVKRRERQALRANYAGWHQSLAAEHGERCANCGAPDNTVLDHIVPIAKGGRSRYDNLQLLCAECNRVKGKLAIDCRAFSQRE
ncbi:MAG: HNH endonuclease [Chloroflexi bacterium]|nr:HNH endonuclease [Chloroflexota bacterium]